MSVAHARHWTLGGCPGLLRDEMQASVLPVTGSQGSNTPQTFAVPQVAGAVQVPQLTVPPQPFGAVPQFCPPTQACAGVCGMQVVPQTLAVPPPPQVAGAVQVPQVTVPPQPSEAVPQF